MRHETWFGIWFKQAFTCVPGIWQFWNHSTLTRVITFEDINSGFMTCRQSVWTSSHNRRCHLLNQKNLQTAIDPIPGTTLNFAAIPKAACSSHLKESEVINDSLTFKYLLTHFGFDWWLTIGLYSTIWNTQSGSLGIPLHLFFLET